MRIVLKYPIILCPTALWVEVETARKPVCGSPLPTASVLLAGFAVLDTPSKKRGIQQPWCLVYRSRYVNLLYTIKLFLIHKNKWMNGICDLPPQKKKFHCAYRVSVSLKFSVLSLLFYTMVLALSYSWHMPKLVSSTSSGSQTENPFFFLLQRVPLFSPLRCCWHFVRHPDTVK